MKNTTLFKSLIDILFSVLVISLIFLVGILFLIPFGEVRFNSSNIIIDNGNFFHWILMGSVIVTLFIFLRGLYYLKVVSAFLLKNQYFTNPLILNIKKSGIHFVYTGVISLLLIFAIWISKLNMGKINIGFDFNAIVSLFIIIIGLFFIIQSKTIGLAKAFKEDNELTV